MKKYIVPVMKAEMFVSNDFYCACYKIKCTTPHNNATYFYMFDDSNDNNILDNQDKQLYHRMGGFWGCNKWHIGVIIDEAPKANGFVSKSKNGLGAESIYWWNEALGSSSDYHVMTPGKENYETNPNAS